MRISDWSSDVCSSDLGAGTLIPGCRLVQILWNAAAILVRQAHQHLTIERPGLCRATEPGHSLGLIGSDALLAIVIAHAKIQLHLQVTCDRNRVWSGNGMSVSVSPGGPSLITKK